MTLPSARFFMWSLPVLAIAAGMPGAARADDAQSHDALIDKLVPPDGPDTLYFRGAQLHSITLRKPAAEFDVEFDGHATQLSPQAKALIRAHRADLATGRLVIAASPNAAGTDTTRGESEKRAETVRDYIVKELGLDPARIAVVDSGADTAAGQVHVAKFAQ